MCEAVFCGISCKIMRFVVEIFLLFIAFHAFIAGSLSQNYHFIVNFRHGDGSAANEQTEIQNIFAPSMSGLVYIICLRDQSC